MNGITTIGGGRATETGLKLPDNLTSTQWRDIGERLGTMERTVGWWVGDWWNAYKPEWGDRAKLFDSAWKGPAYATCRNCGAVARRFEIARRRADLPYSHHAELAQVSDETADAILIRVGQTYLGTGKLQPVQQLRQEVKKIKRQALRAALAPAIERSRAALDGSRLYRVICADPPWAFGTWSENGMDRSAENHYPTMTYDDICDLGPKVPAAADCVLFLWATVPMLLEAIDVMDAWGFAYRSHFVWRKNRIGTGYWNRNRHELLLLGVKGGPMAPDPSELCESVFEGAVGEHSVKPAAAYELIEAMFPNERPLEMFARGERLGWDAWGAEASHRVAA